MYILGISALYHDSAACIIHDGKVIAAAQEERFTRLKHDPSFPANAIRFCLEYAQIELDQVQLVAFYEKPLLKFERVLENFFHIAPAGFTGFVRYIPAWIKQKVFFRKFLNDQLKGLNLGSTEHLKVNFVEHHLSHAAWAYYTSPFASAAILTIDGVGEWTTTSLYHAQGKEIKALKEQHYPHSLGLLYSSFTQYLGFRVNDGEYKMMGLAPYGNRGSEKYLATKKSIEEGLVKFFDDGSIELNLTHFRFLYGDRMINAQSWQRLFGLAVRGEKEELTQDHCDIALAAQDFTEEVVLKLAEHLKELTGEVNLCLAGGVAYNCVANGRIIKSKLFNELHIPPAVGDAGSAVGAALFCHYSLNEQAEKSEFELKNRISFLGPEFSDRQIAEFLRSKGREVTPLNNDELLNHAINSLVDGKVVGWFKGRMEFGARALGARSILGNPMHEDVQRQINLKIKFRESFRPFAVILLEEDLQRYFELDKPSPYMAIITDILESRRKSLPENFNKLTIREKCDWVNSEFPGVTHVDYSSRIQTVEEATNPKLYELLQKFKERTGHSLLINTSFNVNNEPIVCTPQEAYDCFLKTEMDALVMENYWVQKD